MWSLDRVWSPKRANRLPATLPELARLPASTVRGDIESFMAPVDVGMLHPIRGKPRSGEVSCEKGR
jgi:hypothetical protein